MTAAQVSKFKRTWHRQCHPREVQNKDVGFRGEKWCCCESWGNSGGDSFIYNMHKYVFIYIYIYVYVFIVCIHLYLCFNVFLDTYTTICIDVFTASLFFTYTCIYYHIGMFHLGGDPSKFHETSPLFFSCLRFGVVTFAGIGFVHMSDFNIIICVYSGMVHFIGTCIKPFFIQTNRGWKKYSDSKVNHVGNIHLCVCERECVRVTLALIYSIRSTYSIVQRLHNTLNTCHIKIMEKTYLDKDKWMVHWCHWAMSIIILS